MNSTTFSTQVIDALEALVQDGTPALAEEFEIVAQEVKAGKDKSTVLRGFAERSGLAAWLPSAGRMILRNIERQLGRSFLSSLGVAFSVAILVLGMFMFDGVRLMMDLQFREIQREDLSVTFEEVLSTDVDFELRSVIDRAWTFAQATIEAPTLRFVLCA